MSDDRLVLRPTWSNRVVGTRIAVVLAVLTIIVGLLLIDGWMRLLIVTLGASMLIRSLMRWALKSVTVRDGEVVYRSDIRRQAVPLVGVAAFTIREVSTRHAGRGVVVLPDRPLPSLPIVLVTTSAAEQFEAWIVRNHPDIAINPTGTWQDRFGDWHVDEDGVDPAGLLTIGLRPLEVGDSYIEIESLDDGFRAIRRNRSSGVLSESGVVRATRRDAVADGVDLYRRAAVESA